MKKSTFLFLLLTAPFIIQAKGMKTKINHSFLMVNYEYESKYKTFLGQYHYSVYKNYTVGISYTFGIKSISLPTYVSSKLDQNFKAPYDKIKHLDILFGKKFDLTDHQDFILQLNTGLSYLYFQEQFHFLPFNCQLAADQKLTQALGVPLSAILHINTKHRIGFDMYVYSNLNPEKIIMGVGIGLRYGKMKLNE
jgi:hypothetical protein